MRQFSQNCSPLNLGNPVQSSFPSSYHSFSTLLFQTLALNLVFGVDGSARLSTDPNEEDPNDANKSSGEKNAAPYDDHLTPAERRYIEQREKLDVNRLARISNKSHRDRIQDFNQYLANMSEHYDIPKVGPG